LHLCRCCNGRFRFGILQQYKNVGLQYKSTDQYEG
jgi:hypothetical protein